MTGEFDSQESGNVDEHRICNVVLAGTDFFHRQQPGDSHAALTIPDRPDILYLRRLSPAERPELTVRA